ncbi:MAG: DUF6599 family protein [Thermodesulfobacteriota bacterium]
MNFFLWLLVLFFLAFSCSPQMGLQPEATLRAAHLLPDDISGWKKVGPLWEANNHEELFNRLNGGATIFVKYGFQNYAGQIYHNQDGVEVEVCIFLLGTKEKARQLFFDPLMKPRLSKKLENLGEDARLDEGALFYNIIEFLKDRFFIRITVQDKGNSSIKIGSEFAQHILQKINKLP